MPVLKEHEVVAAFGDPTPFLSDEGGVEPSWEASMVRISLPLPIPYIGGGVLKSLRVHPRIAPALRRVFAKLHADGHWPLLKDCGGAYNWRLSRKSNSLSHHCWGIAVDLNVADNPFLHPANMNPIIVDAFKAEGFIWGGDWPTRKDGMHFEYYDLKRLA